MPDHDSTPDEEALAADEAIAAKDPEIYKGSLKLGRPERRQKAVMRHKPALVKNKPNPFPNEEE